MKTCCAPGENKLPTVTCSPFIKLTSPGSAIRRLPTGPAHMIVSSCLPRTYRSRSTSSAMPQMRHGETDWGTRVGREAW